MPKDVFRVVERSLNIQNTNVQSRIFPVILNAQTMNHLSCLHVHYCSFLPSQACTGIDDVGEAIMQLEAANWVLLVSYILLIQSLLHH